jgi:hypothetical protein
MGTALPHLKEGDWGLLKLTNTVLNELADCRQTVEDQAVLISGIRDELACNPGEDVRVRARVISCRAAIAYAIADMIGCDIGRAPDTVLQTCKTINETKRAQDAFTTKMYDVMKWLGAKKDETLPEAVRRVICTYEVQPGAERELLALRKITRADPGRTILETIQEPWDMKIICRMQKGKVVGVGISSTAPWRKIGEVTWEEKELNND